MMISGLDFKVKEKIRLKGLNVPSISENLINDDMHCFKAVIIKNCLMIKLKGKKTHQA